MEQRDVAAVLSVVGSLSTLLPFIETMSCFAIRWRLEALRIPERPSRNLHVKNVILESYGGVFL